VAFARLSGGALVGDLRGHGRADAWATRLRGTAIGVAGRVDFNKFA
jgi:hypothetical protein